MVFEAASASKQNTMSEKRPLGKVPFAREEHGEPSTSPPSYDSLTLSDSLNEASSFVEAYQPTPDDVGGGRIELQIGEGLDDLWRQFDIKDEPTEDTQSTRSIPQIPKKFPPKMNILMLMVGSRGDVQPFICLAAALKRYGHRVRLATHAIFQPLVEEHDIEFFNLGGDPKQLMAYMVKNPGLLPGFTALRTGEVQARRNTMKSIIGSCWRACFQPAGQTGKQSPRKGIFSKNTSPKIRTQDPMPFVADAIIANPPSLGHVHCAERLGIPLHIFFTMPWSPTTHMPHPFANVKTSSKQRNQANFLSYLLVDGIIWQGLGSIINQFRYKTLELDPIHPSKGPVFLQHMRIPHTYCWSPSLLPQPSDWRGNIAVTGYTFLEGSSSYQPPSELSDFLKSGPAPIYIGFGSIVVKDPDALTRTVLEAALATENRAIIATGWNDNDSVVDSLQYDRSRIFILRQDCPHDWLFPKVACVVHHGGAGTTAAGLRAGRPTVIVPFFGDQFFWGDIVFRSGAGPQAIPIRELDTVKLSRVIETALESDVMKCANAIGDNIRSEDGVEAALQHFHSCLPETEMRCSLIQDRIACWQLKSSGIRLSAVAATILRKQRLIRWSDLQIYSPVEYGVPQGPFEPISGAAWAVAELLLDGFRGMGEMIAEIPSFPVASGRLLKDSFARSKTTVPAVEIDTDAGNDHEISKDTMNGSRTGKDPELESKKQKLPGEYMVTGMARVTKAAARAPGEFAAAMARGAHDMPLLWGDPTVRPPRKVTDIKSGVTNGCLELCLGVYDGVSGLFTQPIIGAIDEGPVGFVKGAGRGALGLPTKFFAAASGIVGYPLKGIDATVSRAFKNDGMKAVEHQRMLQGEHEFLEISDELKEMVISRWAEHDHWKISRFR